MLPTGVGLALDIARNLFQSNREAAILIAMPMVVVVAEVAVTSMRQRVICNDAFQR